MAEAKRKSGVRLADRVRPKPVVTVSEMAGMVGLSRSRFYALVRAGTFPPPVFKMMEYRAVYPTHLQRVCLQVRRRNCGVNGLPVRFRKTSPQGSGPVHGKFTGP